MVPNNNVPNIPDFYQPSTEVLRTPSAAELQRQFEIPSAIKNMKELSAEELEERKSLRTISEAGQAIDVERRQRVAEIIAA